MDVSKMANYTKLGYLTPQNETLAQWNQKDSLVTHLQKHKCSIYKGSYQGLSPPGKQKYYWEISLLCSLANSVLKQGILDKRGQIG